jgi:hypothetical protein
MLFLESLGLKLRGYSASYHYPVHLSRTEWEVAVAALERCLLSTRRSGGSLWSISPFLLFWNSPQPRNPWTSTPEQLLCVPSPYMGAVGGISGPLLLALTPQATLYTFLTGFLPLPPTLRPGIQKDQTQRALVLLSLPCFIAAYVNREPRKFVLAGVPRIQARALRGIYKLCLLSRCLFCVAASGLGPSRVCTLQGWVGL